MGNFDKNLKRYEEREREREEEELENIQNFMVKDLLNFKVK